MISEALQAVSEGLFRRLFRFVFRYDIFISYARGDGAKYAAALKDQLTKLDFTCFLDVEELPAGNALTRSLRRALQGSATLVAVVTDRAAASRYCALEVENFAATERAIVPIDFGGTVAKAPWPCVKERELVWIDELPDALTRNVPSPIVADSIDKLFKYTRRNVRVRGQWIGVLVLFLIGAAVATFVIRQQVNEARAAGLEAQRQKTEAVKQTAIADTATQNALAAQEAAKKAAEEARKQEAIALENAARAREEQRKAEAQTRLALSNSMAIDARAQLEQRPIGALLLAAEAAQVVLRNGGKRAPAAEDALRQALARAGGIPLAGHPGFVYRIALSPDHHWLFTSTSDGIGRLWSMREPKLDMPLHILKAHARSISAVSFSPDSRWLATGSEDSVVRIWDLNARPAPVARELALNDYAVKVISWSPDSRSIAVAGGGPPQVWDLSQPDPQSSALALKGHTSAYEVEHILFSANGRWLVTTTRDSYALLWDLTSSPTAREPLKLPTESSVSARGFSNDSHWLAIGDVKGKFQLFDLTAPQIAASARELTGMKDIVFRLAFSPDSRWLAAGGEGRTPQLWDLSKPNPEQSAIALPHAGSGSITDATLFLAFDADSRTLLTGITSSGGEGAHLWRLDQADVPASRVSLQGIGSYVTAAAFVAHDKVAVATMNGLSVWNTQGGLERDLPAKLVGHDRTVNRILTDGDGEWLVTSADDPTPRFWDLREGKRDTYPQRLSDENRHHGRVVLSADGRWLVSELQERESVFVFHSERGDARFVDVNQLSGPFLAMSPDSRWLATSDSREISSDTKLDALALLELRRRDGRMQEPELVGVIEQSRDPERRGLSEQRMTAAAFSANSRILAAGRADGTVQLWNVPVAAGDKGRELRGHQGEIEVVVFSRDGHWLVTGGADMKAILWDLTARNPAAAAKVLSGHDGTLHIALFSPDGRWLFTGSRTQYDSGDGKLSAFLWDLQQPGVPGRVLPGHEGYISAADISADGRWLATGSRVGNYLRLWNLADANPAAKPLRVETQHNGPIRNLGFSRNGRMLLTRSESGAMLWDMQRAGNAMRPFVIGRGLGEIRWAGFTPDNTMLITGGYEEGRLYAWDATAKDPTVAPVSLRGDAGGVFAGAISSDSRVFVGTSNEGKKAWLLRPADLVAAACRIAGRNIPVPDWGVLVPGQAYRKTCPEYPAVDR